MGMIVRGRADLLGRRRVDAWMVGTREHRVSRRRVDRAVMRHGTDDTVFVCLAGELRKELTDADAGHARGDGSQLPANFGWGIRLEIPGVELRRPTGKEEQHTAL